MTSKLKVGQVVNGYTVLSLPRATVRPSSGGKDAADVPVSVPASNTKTHAVLYALGQRRAGMTVTDIAKVLNDKGGRRGAPVTADYAKTWVMPSWCTTYKGVGIARKAGKGKVPDRYITLVPTGQPHPLVGRSKAKAKRTSKAKATA